jgi:hypothetical protein
MKNDNFEHLDLTLGILKFCHWDVLFMVSQNYNKGKSFLSWVWVVEKIV